MRGASARGRRGRERERDDGGERKSPRRGGGELMQRRHTAQERAGRRRMRGDVGSWGVGYVRRLGTRGLVEDVKSPQPYIPSGKARAARHCEGDPWFEDSLITVRERKP